MENVLKMNTENGLDVMAHMLPYLEKIIKSEEMQKIRKEVKADSGKTIADIMPDAFAAIAINNRECLYGIVAAVTGKKVSDVAKMPLSETMKVFSGATGAEIIGFFTYFAHLALRM